MDCACRVIYRSNESHIRIECRYVVKNFLDDFKESIPHFHREFKNGAWHDLGLPQYLHKLMCLAGTHYARSAIYDADGQEMPILEPRPRESAGV